jgi:hypothetical protein
MLEIWFSLGYVLLFAIILFAIILWRTGGGIAAIAAIIVGFPLWFGWEYARPTWTTGTISGTEVRRSDPDARGNTTTLNTSSSETRPIAELNSSTRIPGGG